MSDCNSYTERQFLTNVFVLTTWIRPISELSSGAFLISVAWFILQIWKLTKVFLTNSCSCPFVRYFRIREFGMKILFTFLTEKKNLFWTNKKFVYLIFINKLYNSDIIPKEQVFYHKVLSSYGPHDKICQCWKCRSNKKT